MLRTYVDNIIISLEHLAGFLYNLTTLLDIHFGVVFVHLIIKTDGIEFGICIIILTERMTYPIVTKEETAHIGMIDEFDTQ